MTCLNCCNMSGFQELDCVVKFQENSIALKNPVYV